MQVEVDAANALKDECDRELAVAIPMLEEAVAALNTLKKAHVDEVKNFTIPPAGRGLKNTMVD